MARTAVGGSGSREGVLLVGTGAADLLFGWDWRWLDASLFTGGGRFQASLLLAPLVTTACLVALLWRKQRPGSVFLAVTALTVLAALSPEGHPVFAALLALYTALERLDGRRAGAVPGVMLVVCLIWSYRSLTDAPGGVTPRGFLLVGGLLAGVCVVIGVVARRHRHSTRELHDLELRRRVAASEAVAAERLRLARELHDIVSHAVTGIVLQAAGARRVLDRDPARAAQALAHIEDLGQQAMGELRRLLVVLRDSGGDDDADLASPTDLSDLPDLVGRAQSAGLQVSLESSGRPGTLAPSVALAAYRLVQESLTNAVKHGGPGTRVTVRLTWDVDGSTPALCVEVADRPPGPTAPVPPSLSGGLGLVGLRERVAAVGGTFHAGPTGDGFSVSATLPVARTTGPAVAVRAARP